MKTVRDHTRIIKGTLVKKTLLIIFFLGASVTTLVAQGNTYFSAGIGFPHEPGDFKSLWKPGISLSGGIDAPFTDWIALTAGFDFSSFPLNEAKYIEAQGAAGVGVSVSGGNASILTLMAGAKLTFLSIPKKFAAYANGTIGLFNFSTKDFEVSGAGVEGILNGEEKTAFGGSVGLGAAVPFGKNLELFLEGRYVIGFMEKQSVYLPVRLGLKIQL